MLPQLVDIDAVDQMGLLSEVAQKMDLKQTYQWLDARFTRRAVDGEEEHDVLLTLDEL